MKNLPTDKKKISIDQAADNFFHDLRQSREEQTIIIYRRRLKVFMDFNRGENIIFLDQLEYISIKAYLGYVQELGLKSNTKFHYLNILKIFLSYVYQQAWLCSDLAQVIHLPKWQRVTMGFSAKKIIARLDLFNAEDLLSVRNQALLALHFLNDIPVSIMENLSVSDLDFELNRLRLPAEKSFISIKKTAIQYLKRYLLQRNQLTPISDFLFVTPSGKKMTLQSHLKIRQDFLKKGLK